MESHESWAQFLNWLEGQHQTIKEWEEKALAALNQGDTASYKECLTERAKTIERLPLDGQKVINALPEDLADKVRKPLHRFAGGASMGLKIGSVFFLSALLYRDDHGAGEPDNLACLITKMRAEGLNFKD